MSLVIMGAGAFGTALACTLGRDEPLTLWMRSGADQARQSRKTPRLPDARLPDNVVVTDDPGALARAETILLSVPMQSLSGALGPYAQGMSGKRLVACCKGVDLRRGIGPARLVDELCPDAIPCVLTGPSFAADLARGLPTALTLACADEATSQILQAQFTRGNLRVYRTTDVIGAELGGALKNVIAIAAGAVIGAGLGDSARAALITRGFAEMHRYACAEGAQPETLAGLSGLGDLILTCTSDLSRNYRYGLALGRGTAFDKDITVEGAATAQAVSAKAAALGLEMPVTDVVAGLVAQEITVPEALRSLMSRPLKEE